MSWQTPENSYIVGIFANFATLTEFRNNVGKKQSFDSPGWGPAGPPMGPAPAKPTLEALEELDEEAHWQASWALEHPLAKPPPLKPAWERLLDLRRRWRHDIVRIRREVLGAPPHRRPRGGLANLDGGTPILGSGHLFDAGQAGAHTCARILGGRQLCTQEGPHGEGWRAF